MSKMRLSIILVAIGMLLVACSTQYPKVCPSDYPVGLMDADEIASDSSLPFRFPLEESVIDQNLYFGWFGVSNECPADKIDCYHYPVIQFQAAEDYKRPPGTAVYAMADGHISFSRPAGGYGWLILIDHPQANLYSLYGHLSPSRWKLKKGTDVKRGDLIAFLGDPDENGGSADNPLDPHLHFGIRSGQIRDYPSKGEWRYMAGWIRLCPSDLGWLQPSRVITDQTIPDGGFSQPKVPFFIHWGFEILMTLLYTIFCTGTFIYGIRKKKRYALIVPGLFLAAAGIVLQNMGVLITYTTSIVGILFMAAGLYLILRQSRQKLSEQ